MDASGATSLAAKQAQLPSVSDPKLWMVKVKPGEELEICIAIFNKFVSKYHEKHPMAIFSAVSTSKEHIFVEAYRMDAVKAALTGIDNVYAWKPGSIKMLPIDQMTTALNVTQQIKKFARNDWVRINRGAYKGDLAQVVDVSESGAQVVLKAIPRLDLAMLSMSEEKRKEFKARGRTRRRPPQKKFLADEVIDALSESGAKGAVDTQQHKRLGITGHTFRGNFYADGFLFREWRAAYVETDGPPPTLEELQAFKSSSGGAASADAGLQESLAAELTAAAKRQGGETSLLVPGDNVYVAEGELQGLEGVVVAVSSDGSSFKMTLSKALQEELGMTEHIEMRRAEAIKMFFVGDHVKVVAGMHAGATGTVLHTTPATDENGGHYTAVVMLDSNSSQVSVWFSDLRVTTEVTSDTTQLEGYRKFDLVDVPTPAGGMKQAGIVTSIGHRTLHLLLNNGETLDLPVHRARGNLTQRSKRQSASDSSYADIGVGDRVKVLQGVHRNMEGTIKHVFGNVLFLHSTTHTNHSGCFVVKAKQTLLAGQRTAGPKAGLGAVAGVAAAGSGAGVAGARSQRSRDLVDDEYKGKTVKVLRGVKRGQVGMVKSTVGDTVRVFLQADMKLYTTTRNNIKTVGDRGGSFAGPGVPGVGAASMGGGLGAATPGLGAATPGMGGATPAAGGMTPAGYGGDMGGFGRGGVTPAAGGATPAYGGATPAYGGATPAFGGATPAYGGATPAYGGATPAYGGATPRAGGATPGAASVGGATPGGATPAGALASFGGDGGNANLPSHCMVGVVVRLLAGPHEGRSGPIDRIEGSDVRVQLGQGEEQVAVLLAGSDTAPVPVVPGDSVQLTEGQGGRGILSSIDDVEHVAVVQLSAGGVEMVPVTALLKIQPE